MAQGFLMLLNCHPGKDLPALAPSAAQEADDPQDGGKRHLGQPREEVAGRRDSILLLPLPGHIGVPLERLSCPLVVAVLSVEDDDVADLQFCGVGVQNVSLFTKVPHLPPLFCHKIARIPGLY